uniref:Transmembrane 4 L6 family member 1-like isoform X2 n=1 Tax=Geotrypetes seraphini TaxID=260995 RepID=A0A6P8RLN8_GEOSA|nr:transmembrane 4 L6 family member 1-like isoform X2 [Geotrypetes seraphini]
MQRSIWEFTIAAGSHIARVLSAVSTAGGDAKELDLETSLLPPLAAPPPYPAPFTAEPGDPCGTILVGETPFRGADAVGTSKKQSTLGATVEASSQRLKTLAVTPENIWQVLQTLNGTVMLNYSKMSTGECTSCIGCTLTPLGICAIMANFLLFMPNGKFLERHEITDFLLYFHGFFGAGLLMFISVIFAAVGIAGALYCMIISSMALVEGPLCDTGDGKYIYPFRTNQTENIYLHNRTLWNICKEPKNVILWNIVFLSILLCIGIVEVFLCIIQVFNGIIGVFCGTA